MNEFWTTILNSPVIATGIETLLLCGVVMWLQHIYNKKLEEHTTFVQHDCDIRLERYRLEFNRILSEYQIRFGYWHTEKAKAIKEFYYSILLLCQEMKEFRTLSKMYQDKKTIGLQNILNERFDHIRKLDDSAYKDWFCLRLFLKNTELSIANLFFPKDHSILQSFGNQYKHNNYALEGEKIDKDLDDLFHIVEDLRIKLQDLLKSQDVNFDDKKEQNKSPICTGTDSSGKNGA